MKTAICEAVVIDYRQCFESDSFDGICAQLREFLVDKEFLPEAKRGDFVDHLIELAQNQAFTDSPLAIIVNLVLIPSSQGKVSLHVQKTPVKINEAVFSES